MGAGALTNVFSLRWHGITMTYGNYISFFQGETLVSNDPAFPKGTSQQIMKNGLKVDMPFGKGWTLETYGIYTQLWVAPRRLDRIIPNASPRKLIHPPRYQ
jgi:hypothetical protein